MTATASAATLTAETLTAVDQYEPQYLELIRSDRQQAMAGLADALLEARGASTASTTASGPSTASPATSAESTP